MKCRSVTPDGKIVSAPYISVGTSSLDRRWISVRSLFSQRNQPIQSCRPGTGVRVMKIISMLGLTIFTLAGTGFAAPAQTAGQNVKSTIVVNGVPRSFIVHIPSGYDAKATYPLMIV